MDIDHYPHSFFLYITFFHTLYITYISNIIYYFFSFPSYIHTRDSYIPAIHTHKETFTRHGHCTANPTWRNIFESSFYIFESSFHIFESSQFEGRMSISTETWQKRRSSFELCALKQHSKNVTPRGISCTLVLFIVLLDIIYYFFLFPSYIYTRDFYTPWILYITPVHSSLGFYVLLLFISLLNTYKKITQHGLGTLLLFI